MLEKTRAEFSRLVQDYERDFGLNSYLNRAPSLKPDQLIDAKILSDRYSLLDSLPKNSVVVEVGVQKGNFSVQILKKTIPSHLILIDQDLSQISKDNLALLQQRGSVEFVEDDSSHALSSIEESFCDWIYIDAHHGYEFVSRDIQLANSKIRVGGYLVFNDYTHWSATNMTNYGVSRAVNEFLNSHLNWQVAYLALSGGGYHDIALKRIK